MRRAILTVGVVAILFVASGVASADLTYSLQEGQDYAPSLTYTGAEDTRTESVSKGPWGNAGAFTTNGVSIHDRGSLLFRFNDIDTTLGAVGVTDKTDITSAKLKLYVTSFVDYGLGYGLDTWRMTTTWVEGPDSSSFHDFSKVEGANNASPVGPHIGSAVTWYQPDAATYPNVWATNVTSKCAGISERSTYHDGFCAEVADIATVNSTTNSFYSTASVLYVNTARYNHATDSSRFWLEEDLWPVPGTTPGGSFGNYFGNTPGQNDVFDTTDLRTTDVVTSVGMWIEVDITDWVQDWFETPADNYGVLMRANDGDFDQADLAMSEYGTASLRPILEISIETPPVAEPGFAGLMLVASGLTLRRRRRA